MRGIPNAQAVVGERAVLVLVGSYVDIAVVEIVVGEIPISGDTVSRPTHIMCNRFTDVLSKPIPCVRT